MSDRLVLLGTKGGPAIRPGGPMPTSSLLEMAGRRIVIDCGLGVTRGVVNAGMSLKDLDVIVITHLHSDHLLELGPLLHTAWTSGLNHTVSVLGPPGTRAYWEAFLASMSFDIDLRIEDEGRPNLRELMDLTEYADGDLPIDGLKARAFRVNHPPVTDCFALRFDSPAWSVTFSSDTAYFPPLAGFARETDILVHEAMLEKGVDRLVARTGSAGRLREHLMASHTEAADAVRIARDAGAGHLVLHHLVPADDPGITDQDWLDSLAGIWNGPVTVGRDGMEFRPGEGRDA